MSEQLQSFRGANLHIDISIARTKSNVSFKLIIDAVIQLVCESKGSKCMNTGAQGFIWGGRMDKVFEKPN